MRSGDQEWFTLETDIVNWLREKYSTRLQFRNSHESIVGFPPRSFKSDGMLTDGETLLAIEIESRQKHPDTNVGKYWLLHKDYRQYQKIVLFHVFTPLFDSYGWRKKLAEFYAVQMKGVVPIEYILKVFEKGFPCNVALAELKDLITVKVEEIFLSGNT